ncbi:MAG: NfeD family protein [Pseudomonadaceae bacterium]|nr:MAG: NfeD family protein [Pseudomonadaceae bacterium]
MTGYPFWLMLGLILLISEFFAPGMIAAFFGIGALIVGLLTMFGVIETLPAQLTLFALISLGALFGLRKHCKRWMIGATSNRSQRDQDDSGLVGVRVTVLTDFKHGVGHVSHSGAKWDAESSDPLKAGEPAWVISHRGIVLTVSGTLPANLS